MYTLSFDERFKGAKFVAKDGAQARTLQSGYGQVYDCKPGEWFALTGYYFYDSGDVVYWQTTSGWYVILTTNWPNQWTAYQNSVDIPTYSRSDVQRYVNALIKNNIHIIENNLLCARYANKFTAEQRKQIAELQQRAMSRQDEIKANGFCTDIQESYPKGYAEYADDLGNLMRNEGIGVSIWAICIIGAVAVAGLVSASYFIYRDLFQESEEDVKWSDDLTKVLMEKLTPEEYEQLKEETQGIITKAKLREKIIGWGKAASFLALGIGSILLYKFLSK